MKNMEKEGWRGNQENWSESRRHFELDKVEKKTEINWKVFRVNLATSVSGIIPDSKCGVLLQLPNITAKIQWDKYTSE